MDKTTATVSMHGRDESGNWKQILSAPGYIGRDGKVYVAKDFVYTVYGKDGKAEDKITMQRYEEKYRSSKGKTYIWTYVYSEEKPYIKADGDTVKLDAITSGDSTNK